MGFSVFSFMGTELIAAPPFGAYIGSYNIVVFLTICISYANNCFTL